MPDRERFRVIRPIGEGAFGKTYLAEDTANGNRTVVIKAPKDTGETFLNDLEMNAFLRGSLKEGHPNLVKYYGIGKYQDAFVLVLEYVEGKDLGAVMRDVGSQAPLELSRALRIAADACAGLVAVHNADLLHSDLKPANILIREKDGVAKLCDFGVSSVLRTVKAAGFAGTPLYCAPEVLDERASFQSDIWSLSVVLYQMVTGVVPFEATNAYSLRKKLDQPPTPPKKLNPQVDDRLNALILRGLQVDLRKRFGKAEDMLKELRACMTPGSEPPTKPQDSTVANPARRIVGTLSALAFLGAAVIYARRPPVIEKMVCAPCVVEAGKAASVSWSASGASEVQLESEREPAKKVDKAGSLQVTPNERVRYVLSAKSMFGVTAKSEPLTLIPVKVTFFAMTIATTPTLSWTVSEPTAKVSLSFKLLGTSLAETVPTSGSRRNVAPGEYILTATVNGVQFQRTATATNASILFPTTDAYDLPTVGANVVGKLLFFESASEKPPEPGARKYATTFQSITRLSKLWIFWELRLKNESVVKSPTFPLVGVWSRKNALGTGYEELSRGAESLLNSPGPGETRSYYGRWNGGLAGWFGFYSSVPQARQRDYRVELFVGLKKIASGEFTVTCLLCNLPPVKK